MSSLTPTSAFSNKKQCSYFWAPVGCINGDQCLFSHDIIEVDHAAAECINPGGTSNTAVASQHKIPEANTVHLEERMLKSLVNIHAVDEKRRTTGKEHYLVASKGVVSKGRCVSARFAYDKIRSSFKHDSDRAVGVDLEGTSSLQVGENGVALMVQVSTESEVVVEYPRGSCSRELKQLLTDPNITKVFCGVEGDEKHLDCGMNMTNVVDIVAMATDRFGPTKVKRGLSNILSLVSTNEIWEKRSIKKEKWYWFSNADKMIICKKDFAQYAAADAWGTLLAFKLLLNIPLISPSIALPTPILTSPQMERLVTHPHSQGDPQALVLCRFFLQDRCRSGSACKYRHDQAGGGGGASGDMYSSRSDISGRGRGGGGGDGKGRKESRILKEGKKGNIYYKDYKATSTGSGTGSCEIKTTGGKGKGKTPTTTTNNNNSLS